MDRFITLETSDSPIDEGMRGRGLDAIRHHNNSIILASLRSAGLPAGRVLDVGCGQGQFLTDAKNAGFDALGLEPDGNVVDVAVSVSGCQVLHGFFPDVLPHDERFAAIVFNDVLEHIPDAAAVVARCRSRLQEGGVLVLNCPDQSGVFYRLADALDAGGLHGPFDRLWQRGLPSPHLWYFKPGHLEKLGEKCGLQPYKTISLLPIASHGLRDRIGYVKDQKRLLSEVTYLGLRVFTPLLKFLPRDIAVVFLRRK